MKHAPYWKLLPPALLACAFHASQAQVLDWTATRIDGFGSDFPATDINNAGQVVGWRSVSPTGPRAYLYSQGRIIDISLGGAQSQAYAINETGQVVGWGMLPGQSTPRAFSYAGGVVRELPSPSGFQSEAIHLNDRGTIITLESSTPVAPSLYLSGAVYNGELRTPFHDTGRTAVPVRINNSGQILGKETGSFPRSAFIDHNGVTTPLGSLGGNEVFPVDINASGQAVGNALTENGVPHAFLYSDGRMRDLGTFGGQFSDASDINDAGQVTGAAFLPTEPPPDAFTVGHAFIYADGMMRDLGTLGGNISRGKAINELGQVVGFSEVVPGSNEVHAFIYGDGRMIDLTQWLERSFNDVIAVDSRTLLLNDSGQIVLGALLANGTGSLFVLTPIPEPSTYALILAGLGALAWVTRRRRPPATTLFPVEGSQLG